MAGLPPPKDALTALLAADPVLCQQLETKVLRFSASQRKLLPEAVQEDLSQVDRGTPHVPHSTPPAAPPKPHASQGSSSTKISETIWSNEERSLYVQKLLQSAGQSGQPEMGNAVARFLEDLLAEISAPQPWVMLRSSRGRVFFCNMITRQTTWDHPHEGSLLEAATICKQLLQLDEPWRVNLISHLMEVVAEEEEDFLGKWHSVPAESGLEYFRHSETGEVVWTPPREVAEGLFQCKRVALAKLSDDRYFRQLQLQEPGSAMQLEVRKKNISAAIRMLMEAVDDTSQGSRTPSRPASEIVPRQVLSSATSLFMPESDKASRALSGTSGETPLDSRANTPSAHSRTWEAPLGDESPRKEQTNPETNPGSAEVEPRSDEEEQELRQQCLPEEHELQHEHNEQPDPVLAQHDQLHSGRGEGAVEPAGEASEADYLCNAKEEQEATPEATPKELEFETAVLAFAEALDEDLQHFSTDQHEADCHGAVSVQVVQVAQVQEQEHDETEQARATDSREPSSLPARPTATDNIHSEEQISPGPSRLLGSPPTKTEENLAEAEQSVDQGEPLCAAEGHRRARLRDVETQIPSPAEPATSAGDAGPDGKTPEPREDTTVAMPTEAQHAGNDLALAAALAQLLTPRCKLPDAQSGPGPEAGHVPHASCSSSGPVEEGGAGLELNVQSKALKEEQVVDFITSQLLRLDGSKPGRLAKEKLSMFLQLLGMNAVDIDEALDAAQVKDADGMIDYRAFMKWLMESPA